MDPIIAYCGLSCTDCEAYQATQSGDPAALQRVVEHWKAEYGLADLSVQGVKCDGCTGAGDRRCGHWYDCDIRACGAERGVANCAACSDYACEKLERFFEFVPDNRVRLDAIRAGVAA